jgi:hypothetical protein
MSPVNQVNLQFFRQTERGMRTFACDKRIHTFAGGFRDGSSSATGNNADSPDPFRAGSADPDGSAQRGLQPLN